MMPSLDTFPVPLIHINRDELYQQFVSATLCSEQKVEELNCHCRRFSNFRSGDSVEILGESDPWLKNLLFSTVIFP